MTDKEIRDQSNNLIEIATVFKEAGVPGRLALALFKLQHLGIKIMLVRIETKLGSFRYVLGKLPKPF